MYRFDDEIKQTEIPAGSRTKKRLRLSAVNLN